MARQDPTQDSCRNKAAQILSLMVLMIVGTTSALRAARKRWGKK